MGIYLTYFGIGLAVFVAGMAGFYLVDRITDPQGTGPRGAEGDEPVDTTTTLLRSAALFIAIVGFGGVLFGGVGVVFGLLG